MVATTRSNEVNIDPESDLAKRIEEAGGAPLVLIVGESRYVVRPEEALTPATFRDDEDTRRFLASLARRRAEHPPEKLDDYDPEHARRVLTETAGAWDDVDADALIEMLYRAREEGSRPPNRPGSLDG